MKIRHIAGRELDELSYRQWAALQRANPTFESAFFHPEYTGRVAEQQSNVEIAIVEKDGEAVAFWPFERLSRGVAGPVGGSLADYHGLVGDFAALDGFDPRELLRACQLNGWDFSHLPASQSLLCPSGGKAGESPQIYVSGGFAAYAAAKRAAGSNLVDRVTYLERRLAREIGPVRFAVEETDPAALNQLLRWKSAQYVRTRNRDLFASGPTRAVVEGVWASRAQGFAGVLSTLYAGDHLIAAHFGPRSDVSWSYWFPAHDVSFARFSPGLILLLNMVNAAPRIGLRNIDLGAGDYAYKTRLATGAVPLLEGSLELPTVFNRGRAIKRRLMSLLRTSPLTAPGRALVRMSRSARRVAAPT